LAAGSQDLEIWQPDLGKWQFWQILGSQIWQLDLEIWQLDLEIWQLDLEIWQLDLGNRQFWRFILKSPF